MLIGSIKFLQADFFSVVYRQVIVCDSSYNIYKVGHKSIHIRNDHLTVLTIGEALTIIYFCGNSGTEVIVYVARQINISAAYLIDICNGRFVYGMCECDFEFIKVLNRNFVVYFACFIIFQNKICSGESQ